MKHPWQYDEKQQDGVDYHDDDIVLEYDEKMQLLRDIPAEAEEIADALSLSSESVIWDIGAGTGECALALASRCKHVYATDISPAMVKLARSKARERGIGNASFCIGGFLSGFHPKIQVDAAVSQLALHHLPDLWKNRAIALIAKRLKPGGCFYLKDVVLPPEQKDYDSFFEKAVEIIRAKAGDRVALETIKSIKAESLTISWILEGIIERNGFSIVKKELRGYLTAYLCKKT